MILITNGVGVGELIIEGQIIARIKKHRLRCFIPDPLIASAAIDRGVRHRPTMVQVGEALLTGMER